jgi:hypothetical protein
MKPVPILLAVLLCGHLFVACNDAQGKKAVPAAVKTKTTKKSSKKRGPQTLCTQSLSHAFSEKNKKDVFRITLTGDSILTGTVQFEIINYKKQTIFTQSFPASLLLNYEVSSSATVKEKERFIKQRVKEFFYEENFRYPAVHPDDKFNQEYTTKKYWDAIKADKSAIGFYYLLGEEDGRSIAWSKKLKKVVLYFNCC